MNLFIRSSICSSVSPFVYHDETGVYVFNQLIHSFIHLFICSSILIWRNSFKLQPSRTALASRTSFATRCFTRCIGTSSNDDDGDDDEDEDEDEDDDDDDEDDVDDDDDDDDNL